MSFKKALEFEKENMPDFQWKLEKFMFAYMAVFLGGGILMICACLVMSLLSGEDGGLWYIPLIVWACPAIGMTIPLFIMSKKVKAKLWRYHVENLNKEFYDIDYAEARQNLIDNGKITEEGFVWVDEDSGKTQILPFDEARVVFNPEFWGGKLFMYIVVLDKNDRVFVGNGMDNAYYNFLLRHSGLIIDKNLFALFDKDRERFVKALLKTNNALKLESKLQSI